MVDGLGRLIAFEISPGRLGDARVAGCLLGALLPPLLCAAGMAHDSDRRRAS